MYAVFTNLFYYIQKYFVDYIDVDYSLWVTWLLLPLVISFLLPLMIVLLLYANAVVLYIYRLHRYRLRDAFETDRPLYNGALKFIAAMWDAHGHIWHGYEIRGVENIPDKTPALFILYHGAIPIDLYYFMSRVFLLNNRLLHTVADRFLFKIPGFAIVAEALKVVPGTVQSCSTILNNNNILAISPGGVYEAQFSDSHYQLMWKKRLGFAKVAIEARVPIIPIFTRNVRESFRTVGLFRRVWLKLYSWTKFPLVPIYGGFPVKLITFVGTPIPYDSSLSPEDLAVKVSSALEELIAKNQRIPGSIVRALLERFYEPANSIKHK